VEQSLLIEAGRSNLMRNPLRGLMRKRLRKLRRRGSDIGTPAWNTSTWSTSTSICGSAGNESSGSEGGNTRSRARV
jgi:hypothetical protein